MDFIVLKMYYESFHSISTSITESGKKDHVYEIIHILTHKIV